MSDTRQLAIIRDPRVEFEDHNGRLCLFFETYISECHAAMQVVQLPDTDIPGLRWDVSALEGQPCWVEVDASLIRFVGWWKP